MKKQLLTLVTAALMTGSVWAAPDTVLEKTNSLETTVYGDVQIGALVDRVNQLDQTVYGATRSGTLNSKVDELYRSVAGSDSGVSITQEVDVLEWSYQGAVTQGSLLERLNRLERSVTGQVGTGSVQSRITALKKAIDGKDVKLTPQIGTVAADHVFKVTLNDPISTKTNELGDTFTFTVAEDVMDGDVLIVPAGTVGTGHISELKRASSFGRNGKLDLRFDTIPTIDGTTFAALQGEDAKKKTEQELKAAGASVAGAVLLGPVGLVGGFFVKGKNIELSDGAAIYVQPEDMVTVQGIVIGGDGLNHANDTLSITPVTAPVEETATETGGTVYVPDDNGTVVGEVEEAEPVDTAAEDTAASSSDAEKVKAETTHVTEDSQSATAPSKPIVVVKRS